jgi:hypothetical protein
LTAEIVQNAWREKLDIDIPKINEREAADRLIKSLLLMCSISTSGAPK